MSAGALRRSFLVVQAAAPSSSRSTSTPASPQFYKTPPAPRAIRPVRINRAHLVRAARLSSPFTKARARFVCLLLLPPLPLARHSRNCTYTYGPRRRGTAKFRLVKSTPRSCSNRGGLRLPWFVFIRLGHAEVERVHRQKQGKRGARMSRPPGVGREVRDIREEVRTKRRERDVARVGRWPTARAPGGVTR